MTPWTVDHQDLLSMGFKGKNTGVACHFLLEGIFQTQGLNLGPLVQMVSCTAGGFFSNWATREAPSEKPAGIQMSLNYRVHMVQHYTKQIKPFLTLKIMNESHKHNIGQKKSHKESTGWFTTWNSKPSKNNSQCRCQDSDYIWSERMGRA